MIVDRWHAFAGDDRAWRLGAAIKRIEAFLLACAITTLWREKRDEVDLRRLVSAVH